MSAAIGAYGKLPVSKEFLRHGCYEGMNLEFRRWVDAGFDHASSRNVLAGPQSGNRRWMFAPPGKPDVVVASAIDSLDASGTRRFPFAVFSTVPRKQAVGPRLLGRLEPLWKGLEDKLDEVKGFQDSETFFSTLRKSALNHSQLSADAATAVEFFPGTASDWVERLYSMDPVDLWIRGLWRLRYWVTSMNAAPAAAQLHAVRVPVTGDGAVLPQVDLWLQLLGKLHAVFRETPTLFVPPAVSGPLAVSMIFRTPSPEDFAPGLGGEFESGQVCDLVDGKGKLPIDGFTEFRQRLEAGPLAADSPVHAVAEFDLMA